MYMPVETVFFLSPKHILHNISRLLIVHSYQLHFLLPDKSVLYIPISIITFLQQKMGYGGFSIIISSCRLLTLDVLSAMSLKFALS